MKLVIEINLDNDAFADGNMGAEIARLLRKYSGLVEYAPSATPDDLDRTMSDINGNRVGLATFHE